MQGYFTHGPFFEFFLEDDLGEFGYIRNLMQWGFVVFTPGVGMEGVIFVIESHARADDIQHGDAVMAHRSLDEFLYLFRIPSEGARHKGGIGGQGFHTNINRHVRIGALVLQVQAHFGGGRKLALGQTVHTVVLNDVNHWNVAAHGMLEATHADGGSIAIAGDADRFDGSIAKNGTGCKRGHAPMQAVETKGTVQEIGRAFR